VVSITGGPSVTPSSTPTSTPSVTPSSTRVVSITGGPSVTPTSTTSPTPSDTPNETPALTPLPTQGPPNNPPVTLIRGSNSTGYGVTNNVSPNGTKLTFIPNLNFSGLPKTCYVYAMSLWGSISMTDAYEVSPTQFTLDRNGDIRVFWSNSYVYRSSGQVFSGSPAGDYFII